MQAFSKKNPVALIRLILLAAIAITLISICTLMFNPRLLPSAIIQSIIPADHCHIIAHNPNAQDIWQFNSRSLCATSSICFSGSKHGQIIGRQFNTSKPTCQVSTPLFQPYNQDVQARLNQLASCQSLQHDLVTCGMGSGLYFDNVTCPVEVSIDSFTSNKQPTWLEDITIVVPEYPWSLNIYHYANTVTSIGWVASNIETILDQYGREKLRGKHGKFNRQLTNSQTPTNLNILFHGSVNTSPWQNAMIQILEKRLSKKFDNVKFMYLKDYMRQNSKAVCVRNPIQLGRRGHVNVWPFPNGTDVDLDGSSAPIDSIDFRRSIYEAMNIPTYLPNPYRKKFISDLPPLVVGYARRMGPKAAKNAKNVHAVGFVRRFSDEDESWFVSMLQNETKASGVKLDIFTTTSDHTFEEQVKKFTSLGFVVGIHGANLVNSIFMKPFGVLLEVLPAGVNSQCYIAGSNAGLAYFAHRSTEHSHPIENCTSRRHCLMLMRQSRVVIESDQDREAIVKYVRKGINHLLDLHKRFRKGIPVYEDKETGNYRIDDRE